MDPIAPPPAKLAEGDAAYDPRSALRGLELPLLAAIVESSDDAIVSKNLNGIITSWNRAAERLLGYAAEEIIGQHISVLAAPGRENEMPMILERIRRGERIDNYETFRRRKDGSVVELSLTISPIRDELGEIVGASKIARNISERRRAEQERELRLKELRHRIKNLLGMVSAIAGQTTVKDRSAEEYRDDFRGRLQALMAAHEAAFQEQDGTDLAGLVARLLEPYTSADEAMRIGAGPAVSLPRQKVQPLAFVLHELATNAVKHGALSKPEGRLRIAWSIEETNKGRCLHLDWKELGGPPVGPPSTQGFGMRLIRFASTHELGGEAALTFASEGLRAKITAWLG